MGDDGWAETTAVTVVEEIATPPTGDAQEEGASIDDLGY